MSEVEQVKPYHSEGGKREQVEQMFDNIAPAYDFMNRAMTLGIDRWWRRVAVNRVRRHSPARLLDVATGTGDFAIALHKRVPTASEITGIDLSAGMLDVAREKVAKKGIKTITFRQADCLSLPFDDGSFDAVTVAFGVRNFENLAAGYAQMHRVLADGGMICVLELSTPRNRFVRWFYDLYTLHVIPFIGSLKSGDKSAYRYLPQSIAAVPQGDDMLALMREAGFTQCKAKTLTLGTCTIYTAVK